MARALDAAVSPGSRRSRRRKAAGATIDCRGQAGPYISRPNVPTRAPTSSRGRRAYPRFAGPGTPRRSSPAGRTDRAIVSVRCWPNMVCQGGAGLDPCAGAGLRKGVVALGRARRLRAASRPRISRSSASRTFSATLVRQRKRVNRAQEFLAEVGGADARRSRRACRPRHRPIRRPDDDRGGGRAARLPRNPLCRRRQTLSAGREYGAFVALRLGGRRGRARQTRRRRLAEAQGADAKRILEMAAGSCESPPRGRPTRRRSSSRPSRSIRHSARGFPYDETEDQAARSRPCSTISPREGRWTGSSAATSASARRKWRCAPPSSPRSTASRWRSSCRRPCWRASTAEFCRPFRRPAGQGRAAVAHGRTAEHQGREAALATGEVDIVVGTHALLGKQIAFKDLGLVIIDEEQHFGVKHKERLKELRAEVHVLTLSATPIPRTLQLALTGVRELSIIATPPVDRLAVRTSSARSIR